MQTPFSCGSASNALAKISSALLTPCAALAPHLSAAYCMLLPVQLKTHAFNAFDMGRLMVPLLEFFISSESEQLSSGSQLLQAVVPCMYGTEPQAGGSSGSIICNAASYTQRSNAVQLLSLSRDKQTQCTAISGANLCPPKTAILLALQAITRKCKQR